MNQQSPTAEAPIEQLLDRSSGLLRSLAIVLANRELVNNARALVAEPMCCIALEHGASILVLVRMESVTSAIALMRAQLEVLVRAIWIGYAATDTMVMKFLPEDIARMPKEPNNLPRVDEMLSAISASAPKPVGKMLTDLKQGAWAPMNSYVHGGMRPIMQYHLGYPPRYLVQTVLNANGLSTMAAMMVAEMCKDSTIPSKLRDIQLAHLDCLPPLVQPNISTDAVGRAPGKAAEGV